MLDFDWERDIEISVSRYLSISTICPDMIFSCTQGTPIEWKDPANALTKLRPRPDMEEIEKRLKGEDNEDSITIDTGSFFHYFEEKDDEFDVRPKVNPQVLQSYIYAWIRSDKQSPRKSLLTLSATSLALTKM